MNSFLSWVKKSNPNVAAKLNGKSPGSTAFNTAWKGLASSDPNGFAKVQHDFIKHSHYDPVVAKAKELGLNLSGRTMALQNAIWSTSVQHGVGGATSVLRAAINGNPNVSDAELIKRIYGERSANNGMKYFGKSSPSIRQSVVSRFQRELSDALNML